MIASQTHTPPPGHGAGALEGKIVSPTNPRYDEARRAWNLAVDQRPAAVVLPRVRARRRSRRPVRRRAGVQDRPAGNRPQRRSARIARGHDPAQDRAHARRPDRRGGAGRPRRGRRAVARGRRGRGAAPPAPPSPAPRPTWAWSATRSAADSSFLGRRHGLSANAVRAIEIVTADGRLRPLRSRERTRPVLGAARRRWQLRRRDRGRARAVPDRARVRRRPLLPDRARHRGAARLARADAQRPRARRADHRRPVLAAPAAPGDPRGGPRQVVRDGRGLPPGRSGAGRRAARPPARPRTGQRHDPDGPDARAQPPAHGP